MNTTTRRIFSTAAATALLSLATAVPATAKPEWTEPAASTESRIVIHEVSVDDDAWEYAQIGLGVLAGAALVGAAGVAVRRQQHTPHPA